MRKVQKLAETKVAIRFGISEQSPQGNDSTKETTLKCTFSRGQYLT